MRGRCAAFPFAPPTRRPCRPWRRPQSSISILANILTDPTLIVGPISEDWSRRADALYLENFFQKEKIRELYLEMEKAAPEDPSVKYALYGITRQFKEGTRALEYLKEAAALDPVYALEYLSLAELAMEKQRPHDALRMLQSASETFPGNPFIQNF